MKTILLAAGRGSRLEDLTEEIPKPFVKLKGRSIIYYFLDSLIKNNITELYIVVGYKKEYFTNQLGNQYKTLKIHYIENDIWDKSNNIYSLKLALDIIEDSDIFLFEADLYLNDKNYIDIFNKKVKDFILISKYREGIPGTVILKNKEGFEFILKKDQNKDFDYRNVYKTVNIYKFSKETLKSLKQLIDNYILNNSIDDYYEVVFNDLLKLHKLNLLEIDHNWYEVDTKIDLKEATKLFETLNK